MTHSRLVFITHAQFWKAGVGFWVRSRTLLSYLADRFEVRVYYLGSLSQEDRALLAALPFTFNCTELGGIRANQKRRLLERFREQERGRPQARAYIIDRIQNSFMLQALPKTAVKILDMHDLVHARASKEKRHQAPSHFSLTLEQEQKIMRRYSAVLCIQHDEHEIVRRWIGGRALLAPHPVMPQPQLLKNAVKSIGIVASGWHANVNGLRHFLDRVWPQLADLELNLLIFGFIASNFQGSTDPRIQPLGFQPSVEDCYRQMDIAINPVYYGAGLKIKSVEAMSFGLPLATTPEGASGLEKYADQGLVIARNDEEYVAMLRKLATDLPFRQRIAEGAVDIISRDFSQESCFSPLESFLDSLEP